MWLIYCESGCLQSGYPLTYQIICCEGVLRTWGKALLLTKRALCYLDLDLSDILCLGTQNVITFIVV